MSNSIQIKSKRSLQLALPFLISMVWIVNGLYCKILNGVPRHRQIVASILGNEHAAFFTQTIGFLELGMAAWILSFYKKRICTITQIAVVATMNIIEFIAVPELLLFGRWNAFLAVLFIALLIYQDRILFKNLAR